MGLFNFIKEAGKKLGIGGGDDAPDVEAVKRNSLPTISARTRFRSKWWTTRSF